MRIYESDIICLYKIKSSYSFLFLRRDQACLRPAVWHHRAQQWAPQDTATVQCLALGCRVWWTRLVRGQPHNRFSRFSSSKTVTSSKSPPTNTPHTRFLLFTDVYTQAVLFHFCVCSPPHVWCHTACAVLSHLRLGTWTHSISSKKKKKKNCKHIHSAGVNAN